MKKINYSSIKGVVLGIVVYLLLQGQVARADFVLGEPTLVPNVNTNFSDGSPQISRDGLELYFSSKREGGANKIWVSRRTSINDPWSIPLKLDVPLADNFPSLSTDGLELYFPANGDIWVVTRASKNDAWDVPENLGPTVNSENDWEGQPCISADGLSLYYMSTRFASKNNELLVTTRPSKEDPWGEAVHLGPNVNTNQFEYTPFISSDGLSLYFSRGAMTTGLPVLRDSPLLNGNLNQRWTSREEMLRYWPSPSMGARPPAGFGATITVRIHCTSR
jgi:hypothetical protein